MSSFIFLADINWTRIVVDLGNQPPKAGKFLSVLNHSAHNDVLPLLVLSPINGKFKGCSLGRSVDPRSSRAEHKSKYVCFVCYLHPPDIRARIIVSSSIDGRAYVTEQTQPIDMIIKEQQSGVPNNEKLW